MVDTCRLSSDSSLDEPATCSERPPARRTHKVYDNIIAAIGHTPLVRLSRCFPDAPFHLFAKLESSNPGGSAKDRSAWGMLQNAMTTGELKDGGTVIESSSGNMAIGLAQACCYFGLHFICVVDAKTSSQHVKILQTYGAEVITISDPDPTTGEFLHARLQQVKELVRDRPNALWLNQYANEHNAHSHRQTMSEIVDALDGHVDYVVCPVSTCGTIKGCQEYILHAGLDVTLIAVDAVGSVIFGGSVRHRLLPGHGSAIRPKLADDLRTDQVVHVSDADCVAGCRRLVRAEGILVGASSGGAIAAIAKLYPNLVQGTNCVVILPDRGERYIDTVYSNTWVDEHFGSIPQVDGQGFGVGK